MKSLTVHINEAKIPKHATKYIRNGKILYIYDIQ